MQRARGSSLPSAKKERAGRSRSCLPAEPQMFSMAARSTEAKTNEPACSGAETVAAAIPQTPSATPCASPSGPRCWAPRRGLCTRPRSPLPRVSSASLPWGFRYSAVVSAAPPPPGSRPAADAAAAVSASRRMRWKTECSEVVTRAPAPASPPTTPPISIREPSTKCSVCPVEKPRPTARTKPVTPSVTVVIAPRGLPSMCE
eukprot:scaffold783_cov112-Isochrysis_galbana.AAC.3